MAKLYYGNGSCTVEGSEIRGIEIRYRGAIEIEDKTSDSFVVMQQGNGIVIFPNGDGYLNDLFDYVGEFNIIYVIAAGKTGKKVPITIHKVMDYSELLNTNAEDMTTNSEDLSATYVSGKRVAKTTLNKQYINNQNTSRHDGELYLSDGTLYEGYFHVHLSDSGAMTGKEHTGGSQDLYFKDGKPTKVPKFNLPALAERKKRKKIKEIKDREIKKNSTGSKY